MVLMQLSLMSIGCNRSTKHCQEIQVLSDSCDDVLYIALILELNVLNLKYQKESDNCMMDTSPMSVSAITVK